MAWLARFIAATAICGASWAQCPSGYTSVSDTIFAPVNQGSAATFSGRVIINPPSVPITSGSTDFGRTPTAITVANGVFSACLVPNDTATPAGTVYSVAYQGNGGERWSENWSVPTSGSPVKIPPIRTNVSAAPTSVILWSQISLPAGGVSLPGQTIADVAGRYSLLSYSPSPIFDLSVANVFKITLTGDVSTATFPNVLSAGFVTLIICQDATGNHSFTWPARVHGGIGVGRNPNACSVQDFVSDGDQIYARTLGVVNQ